MTPEPLRKLKAKMAMKDLRLKDIVERTGFSYTYCSEILSGKRNDSAKLDAIKKVIREAPIPQEAAA